MYVFRVQFLCHVPAGGIAVNVVSLKQWESLPAWLEIELFESQSIGRWQNDRPPGACFRVKIAGSDAPAVACATVYPLTTLLRVLLVQVLALTFQG